MAREYVGGDVAVPEDLGLESLRKRGGLRVVYANSSLNLIENAL